jgi:hypothetical protein
VNFIRKLRAAFSLSAAMLLAAPFAQAGPPLGATALQSRHAALASQLANNAFGGPIVLQSQETSRRVDGDVFAVLDHPFANVNAALSDPGRWCDVLILHLNTKYCRRTLEGTATHIELRVGKKTEQPLKSASLLDFAWKPAAPRPDYLVVQMEAADGPYDTSDYQLVAEAVPLDAAHTFLHMGYSFGFGGASSLAMKLYLATIGHDKVGFTQTDHQYVGGMRGVTERNTMRYYLAIDAYLHSLSAPPGQQLDKRFAAWFDATERYPRQLHEVERDEYLRMKRNEYQRQQLAP